MRIMLHDSYERKLITLAESKGLSPSMMIKELIQDDYRKRECTLDAQGGNNGSGTEQEKEL